LTLSARPWRTPIIGSVVVLVYEILLVLASVMISWFTIYVLYRLITDESNLRR